MNLGKTIFNINQTSLPPEEGKLLVAEPFLREDYFNHAVILMIDCQKGDNTMGLVLNRASEYTLGQVVKEVNEDLQIPIFCGGPLSTDRLFYIHTLGPLIPNSRQIGDNLYVGGDFSAMVEYITEGCPTEGLVRFFAGYSGWSPGQLEEEIDNHVWAVADALEPSRLLVGRDNSYWHKIVRTMGDDYRGWLFHPMYPLSN